MLQEQKKGVRLLQKFGAIFGLCLTYLHETCFSSPFISVICYNAPLLEEYFCIDRSDKDQMTKECSAKISHNGRLVQAKGKHASFPEHNNQVSATDAKEVDSLFSLDFFTVPFWIQRTKPAQGINFNVNHVSREACPEFTNDSFNLQTQ